MDKIKPLIGFVWWCFSVWLAAMVFGFIFVNILLILSDCEPLWHVRGKDNHDSKECNEFKKPEIFIGKNDYFYFKNPLVIEVLTDWSQGKRWLKVNNCPAIESKRGPLRSAIYLVPDVPQPISETPVAEEEKIFKIKPAD